MEKQIESKTGSLLARIKRVFVYGAIICIAFVFIVYLWACFSIRSGVINISAEATQQYPGDRVEALISYVKDERQSFRKRNLAVWALGQIGDKRALPVLTQFYTGEQCDHGRRLCQGELQKAIKLCKGSFNASI